MAGGEGGIRTHGTVTRTLDFESSPFGHSGTSPPRSLLASVWERQTRAEEAQRLINPAAAKPSHAATRQSTTDKATFAPAAPSAPPRASSSGSRLNDENVVKPPSTPTSTNERASGLNNRCPSAATSDASRPIANDPATLTNSVPYGKPAPSQRTAAPEHA